MSVSIVIGGLCPPVGPPCRPVRCGMGKKVDNFLTRTSVKIYETLNDYERVPRGAKRDPYEITVEDCSISFQYSFHK
jgi:hypothetical protein